MFSDRRHAGRLLAGALTRYRGASKLLVLALPRGGVPVGQEVALALQAPLDVLVVRKLGVPWQPELAMGAVAGQGVLVANPAVLDRLNISEHDFALAGRRAWEEVKRREALYRPSRRPLEVKGKTIILVDDGVATGSTLQAAILLLRAQEPRHIVVAVPVAAATAAKALSAAADEVVCLHTPANFTGVGAYYEDFSQLNDEEVSAMLEPREGAAK